MTLVEWSDAYALGIAEIDAEHRAMIEEINAVHARLGEQPAIDEICARLGEILAHISAHFALEEKNMRACAYPSLGGHKQDHERLIGELIEIIDSVERTGAYDPSALAQALQAWFVVHFSTHDAQLHRFVNAAGG